MSEQTIAYIFTFIMGFCTGYSIYFVIEQIRKISILNTIRKELDAKKHTNNKK